MVVVHDLRGTQDRAKEIITAATLIEAGEAIRQMREIVSVLPVDVETLKHHLRSAMRLRSRVRFIGEEAPEDNVQLKEDCRNYCELVSNLIKINILGEEEVAPT